MVPAPAQQRLVVSNMNAHTVKWAMTLKEDETVAPDPYLTLTPTEILPRPDRDRADTQDADSLVARNPADRAFRKYEATLKTLHDYILRHRRNVQRAMSTVHFKEARDQAKQELQALKKAKSKCLRLG